MFVFLCILTHLALIQTLPIEISFYIHESVFSNQYSSTVHRKIYIL